MDELTFGQKAVGLNFNPSGDDAVAQVKQTYANAIDQLNDIRSGPAIISGGKARLISIAVTQAEIAQMCAVKALTWND